MYGLDILQEDIQNNNQNRTRFAALSKEMIIPKNAEKISLCFSLPHTTGSLYSVLARFAMTGLNLTKIESRPLKEGNNGEFKYNFIWILPEMYIIAIHWTYFVPYPKNFPISPFRQLCRI